MIISEEMLRKKIKKALIEGTFGTISMGSGAQQSDEDEESGNKKDLKDFVEMKDVDIEAAKSNKVSGATGRESGIKVSKVFEIAEKTGMKPSGVYGFMTVESGGNASAMATNPHKISGEPSLYSTPFGLNNHKEITKAWKRKGVKMESYYNAHSNDDSKAILEKMESVNKLAATSVTAFGSMQVMGAFILPRFNNDPDALHASFKSDPEAFSVNALFDWVNHKDNKDFLGYVNKGDYKNAVKRYYGADNSDYVKLASSAAARFESHLEKHKKEADASSAEDNANV
jgi:hypothetical protein